MSADDKDRREERESADSSGREPSEQDPSPPEEDSEVSSEDEGEAAGEETKDPSEGVPPEQPEQVEGREEQASEKQSGKEASDLEASEEPTPPQEEEEDEKLPATTYYDDPYEDYEYEYGDSSAGTETTAVTKPEPKQPPPPPPPAITDWDEEADEQGMTRMSFLEHLEELRTRILHALYGLVIAYLGCLAMAQQLFSWLKGPFDRAVGDLPPESKVELIAITPVEQFHLLYIKLPLVAAIFVAAPWLMYQVWAFIAPGLYRRERRWAGPFVLSTAGLFIAGGLFGYFVALRFAFAFLLGLGQDLGIQALISISSYFNTFISIMLGLGVVFQLPIVIFFLTLLRIVKPGFLLTNVRYAILAIFVIAAIITPTPDVFNLIIFAMPMILLFYLGIGASYLLLWHRERRTIPWGRLMLIFGVLVLLLLAGMYYLHAEFGYRFVLGPPWIIQPQ